MPISAVWLHDLQPCSPIIQDLVRNPSILRAQSFITSSIFLYTNYSPCKTIFPWGSSESGDALFSIFIVQAAFEHIIGAFPSCLNIFHQNMIGSSGMVLQHNSWSSAHYIFANVVDFLRTKNKSVFRYHTLAHVRTSHTCNS